MQLFEDMLIHAAEAAVTRPLPDKTALLLVDLMNKTNRDDGAYRKILGFDIRLHQAIEPNVHALIRMARRREIPVIAVQAIYDFAYLFKPMRERFQAMGIEAMPDKGSWDAALNTEVLAAPPDLILVKSHYSAFASGKTFGYRPGNPELEAYMQRPAGDDAGLRAMASPTMVGYFEAARQEHADADSHLDDGGVVNLQNYLNSRGIDTLIVSGGSTHVCVDATVSAASERGYKVLLPRDAIAAEGIGAEGLIRHYVYACNLGMFKAEIVTSAYLLRELQVA